MKFYLVAMLFIIFDIETIFLFPWAVTFRELGLFGLVEMAVFIGLVFVAYVYVWQQGRARLGAARRSSARSSVGAACRRSPGRPRSPPIPARIPAETAGAR